MTLSGATASTVGGVTTAFPGGVLTQDRLGVYHRNRFAWSPDVGLKLGYQLTDHMRATVGYDFLYLSDVARAGDQVDQRVNPARAVGMAGALNPPFVFHGTDFWAQGLNFGLEFRY